MSVQVKFDKSKYKDAALAESTQSGHQGTIYFTKDENNHQIIINGQVYGGTPHNLIETTWPVYNTVADFNKSVAAGGTGGESTAEGQAYLKDLFEKKEGDYYIYKKLISDKTLVTPAEYYTKGDQDAGIIPSGKHIGELKTDAVYNNVAEYEYTAYVCTTAPVVTHTGSNPDTGYHLGATGQASTDADLGVWKAFDGNYDARNVFLDSDIKMAGAYTRVGNKVKNTTQDVITWKTKGMSVKEALKEIFTEENWPGAAGGTRTISGPTATSIANPGFSDKLYVYAYAGDSTTLERKAVGGSSTLLIPEGSPIYIGGSDLVSGANPGTAADKDKFKLSYSTADYVEALDGGSCGAATGIQNTWLATPASGTSVTAGDPNWGYTKYPTQDPIPKLTMPLTSGWNTTTGRTFTYVWTRHGGAGSLSITATTPSGGTSIGSVVCPADTSMSTTWAANRNADTYSVYGGRIASATALGSVTITAAKSDADYYTREHKANTPSELKTNKIDMVYELSNIDGYRLASSTEVGVQTVIDNNKTATSTSTSGSESVTLKAVYPIRHNGKEFSSSSVPADEASSVADTSYYATAVSGTLLSNKLTSTGLVDGSALSASGKVIYIGWPHMQAGGGSYPRYIDLPKYDASHYLTMTSAVRVLGTWQTATWTAVTGGPTGYQRYKMDGSTNGSQVVQITLKK